MATRNELANRRCDLSDINAGTIATGSYETIRKMWLKLFHLFSMSPAAGKDFSDQWGLHKLTGYIFNPAPVRPDPVSTLLRPGITA